VGYAIEDEAMQVIAGAAIANAQRLEDHQRPV
jgi:hypothetical protein